MSLFLGDKIAALSERIVFHWFSRERVALACSPLLRVRVLPRPDDAAPQSVGHRGAGGRMAAVHCDLEVEVGASSGFQQPIAPHGLRIIDSFAASVPSR